MNSKSSQLAIVIMWLVPPLTALRYWSVWARLPSRMAAHFNAAGQPNGYVTAQGSLVFVMGLMTFVLVIVTVVLSVIQKKCSREPFALANLRFFYVLLGFIC